MHMALKLSHFACQLLQRCLALATPDKLACMHNALPNTLLSGLLQALQELALDYENDKADVAVPIMYDDETAYLCDQGGK